jgi:subtilisin family serine protease
VTEPHHPDDASDPTGSGNETEAAGNDEFEDELAHEFGPDEPESGAGLENLSPRIYDEVGLIKRAFDHHHGIAVRDVQNDTGLGYLHADGHILVHDGYLSQVEHVLAEAGQRERRETITEGPAPGRPDSPVDRVIDGVVRLRLDTPQLGVTDALEAVENALGRSVATPDHVLTVAGEVGPCPATEPEEVSYGIEPSPLVSAAGDGAGVLTYVFDTGLLPGAPDAHPWLAGVTGQPDPRPVTRHRGRDVIRPYAGHGTFVAGVIRSQAPATELNVLSTFSTAGSVLESDLVRRLDQALGLGVDIFHLSVATASRHGLPLIAFRKWLERMNHYKGTICIAAAGNSGQRTLQWPGAFRDVLAVGALTADGHSRASFSNYGGWVDVYAPGRNLVNAYATGSYRCHIRPYRGQWREFHGMAQWSGTSFSTPVVTGMIAARMSRTGENARQAADALLAQARAQAIPGVGAVLRPGRD